MMMYADLLIWLVPVIATLLSPIVAKVSRNGAHALSVSAVGISWILALSMIFDILSGNVTYYPSNVTLGSIPFAHRIVWIDLTSLIGMKLSFGILIDPFSVFMANVVSFVALWIFIFSIGYMSEEPDIGRYWFLMNLFLSSMLLLVLSSNLLQMFIAWEMVGLCSWSLISFWYKSKAPSPDPRFSTEGEYNAHCGLKALITTSFADAFFLVAIAIVGYTTHLTMGTPTFDFIELSRNFSWLRKIVQLGIMPIFSLFLISGPFGKSAQFPYHEWLPEAMAGPTTVSALIHAATMVKAGAYFVGRFFLIIYTGATVYGLSVPDGVSTFFLAAAYVGAFTAFLAGTQGMVAKELKKILAYSTISQLGYIFAVFGIAGAVLLEEAFFAGALHILAHAVFKALLFLCAGAVLHAVHSKYVYDMGGLKKYMPVTYFTMLVGALSLSGVPPFAGFFSKDLILHAAMHFETMIPYVLLLVTAVITVFYTFRMIGLVFHGEPSEHIKKMNEHGHHIHEAPLVMRIPLIVLAVTTIIVGFFFEPAIKFIAGEHIVFEELGHDILSFVLEVFSSELILVSAIVILTGFIPAYYIYIARKADPTKIVESNIILRALYKFLVNRWYIDPLYYKIADGLRGFSARIRKLQTGYANVNIVYMIIGFILFLITLILM